jgi:tetratricopeptide (TPR) repeat protein
LAIYESVLGTEHPSTATTYNNIALVYTNQGKYDEALKWYRKDLAISEKSLGKNNPKTVSVYDSIAEVRKKMGK